MKKKQMSSALDKFQIIRPYLEDDVALSVIAQQHDLGLSSLKRWVKSYHQNGIRGLERKSRSDKGNRHTTTNELEQLIEALVLTKPPISLAAIHRRIEKVAKNKGIIAPSYRVVRDIASKIEPSLIVLAQEGSKVYNQEYELIYRREATCQNEIWQADHTPLDIVLLNEEGKAQKPWLTTIIDDYSRAICGYFLSFDAPCSINTALALRQAIWRKSNPKWQVCGIPNIFYSDNGSDFKSKHIQQVAADLKIQLKNSIPGKPRGRGRIERFFLTVNQLLLMNLSGYCPPKTAYPEAIITLEEFIPLFEHFLIEDYHPKIHSGINQAPIERWIGNEFSPQLPTSLEQLDLLLLTVVKPRKVRRDGIHFQNLIYIEPTLAAYVGESVIIRYDPRDLAEIRVYHNNTFLCRAICQELAGEIVSLKDIIRARQKRKRELRKTIAERKSLMDTLLEKPKRDTIQKPTIKPEKNPPKKHRLKLYKND